MTMSLFRFHFVKFAMKGRGFATSFIGVKNVVLRSFCDNLLQLAAQSDGLRLLAFFDQFIHLLGESFDMGLQKTIAFGAALIFAQIFNGGMLVWHRIGLKSTFFSKECQYKLCERVFADRVCAAEFGWNANR